MTRFSNDTALESLGNNRYRVTIDQGWFIEAGPNGGYLAAIVLRAITWEIGDPAYMPRSFTLHYLRPPKAGPADLEVTIERQGRTVVTATARMWQDDKLQVISIAAFGTDRDAPGFVDMEAPTAPAPETVERWEVDEAAIPLRGRWDQRWTHGAPPLEGSDRAFTGGWMRLIDGDPADYLVLAAMTDAWLPPIFTRLGTYLGVPTLDLTIHFRQRLETPLDDFVLGLFETKVAAGGYLEEDATLWSRDGQLLAQSRQLALILAPPTA
jgi:acyl-CoA thioesterase